LIVLNGTRKWEIRLGLKFYGCLEKGDSRRVKPIKPKLLPFDHHQASNYPSLASAPESDVMRKPADSPLPLPVKGS